MIIVWCVSTLERERSTECLDYHIYCDVYVYVCVKKAFYECVYSVSMTGLYSLAEEVCVVPENIQLQW